MLGTLSTQEKKVGVGFRSEQGGKGSLAAVTRLRGGLKVFAVNGGGKVHQRSRPEKIAAVDNLRRKPNAEREKRYSAKAVETGKYSSSGYFLKRRRSLIGRRAAGASKVKKENHRSVKAREKEALCDRGGLVRACAGEKK